MAYWPAGLSLTAVEVNSSVPLVALACPSSPMNPVTAPVKAGLVSPKPRVAASAAYSNMAGVIVPIAPVAEVGRL